MQENAESPPEIITSDGDVILHIEDHAQGFSQKYRCTRSLLREKSKYFDVLLDPRKFREGISAEALLSELTRRFGSTGDIPSHLLPVVRIKDLPKVLAKLSVLKQSLVIVLSSLCDLKGNWDIAESRATERLLQIALLAERLDGLASVRPFLERHLKRQPPNKSIQKETALRQQLLLGWTLGIPSYMAWSSANLVVKGSRFWLEERPQGLAEEVEKKAAWDLLPDGIEEELQARRNYVLDALSSIQMHFAMLYSSELQCRRGLSNSKDCDIFQLGQIMRFFTKRGTLHVGSVFAEREPDEYKGDLDDLIARLKNCPHYQLDQFHAHCGVRERMIPILKRIRPAEQTGICLPCWRQDRAQDSWLEAAEEKAWTSTSRVPTQWQTCADHRDWKAMYTAPKHDWTYEK